MRNELLNNLLDIKESLKRQKELGNDFLPKGGKKTMPKKKTPAKGNAKGFLEKILADMGSCTHCRLHKGRNCLVFGEGNPDADIMFVGEAPGAEEDKQGRPFVGRAGQLLTKIIESMGLKRDDVYIANIIKCRPPENRNPAPDEIAACEPYLIKQIEVINPKVIVCLGTFAAQTLLKTEEKISNLRGKLLEYRGTRLIPTYHPAFLLRNPSMKRPVWEDMKLVMKELKL